jgi:predicted component of type VI protein secretion system
MASGYPAWKETTMGARLLDAQGHEFSIPPDHAVVLGRLPTCAIPIQEASVSREHAKIFLRDERYLLVDLNSANGTFVNGKRVTRAELADGDEVTLGSARLVFENGVAPSAPPAAPAPPVASRALEVSPAGAPESSGFNLEDDPFANDADVVRAETEVEVRVSQPARGQPRAASSAPVIQTRDEVLQFRAQPRNVRGGMLREDLQQRPLSFQILMVLLGLGVAALLFFGVRSVVAKLMPNGEDSAASSEGNG